MLLVGININYMLHPKELIHPNKLHHLSQHIHQLPEFLFAAVVLITIHITDRIEHKVDMGDPGILMDGVGNLVTLADDSGDFVGGIDDVFHAVDVAWGEGNDEVIDPDSLILSEGSGGLGHLVGCLGDGSVAEADDVVGCFLALGDVIDKIVAGGIVLILACCICKFYISHNKKLLYFDWNPPGLLPQGDAQCIPGIPNKVLLSL